MFFVTEIFKPQEVTLSLIAMALSEFGVIVSNPTPRIAPSQ